MCRNRYRQSLNVRLDEVRAVQLRDARPLPEAVRDRAERRREAARLVASLPPRCGLVCALVFLEGFSHREVAQQLGISMNAVEKQVARGRAWLRHVARGGSGVSIFLDGGGGLILCLQGIRARYRGGRSRVVPRDLGTKDRSKLVDHTSHGIQGC